MTPNLLATLPTAIVERFRNLEAIVFDFDGVFTDNSVWVAEDGTESVRCSRGDGIGLAKLPPLGVRAMVLSTEENPVVRARCQKLKLTCVQNCPDKAAALPQLATETLGTSLERLAYVGNDTNDAGALAIVGFPIVVADAHPDVIPLGLWKTTIRGGYGAVREICDLIATAKALPTTL